MLAAERHLKFIRHTLCRMGLVPTPSDQALAEWIRSLTQGPDRALFFRRQVERVRDRVASASFRIPRAWTMTGGAGTVRINPSNVEHPDV